MKTTPEITNKITNKIKPAPEKNAGLKSATIITRPALNLSIDDISIEHKKIDDDFMNDDKAPTDTANDLFITKSRHQIEPAFNLGGKLLTDENKLANREYIDSVEGVEINIKGKFN